MCVLVLFPVLVYFVWQSSLWFPLSCLSKTSWSRGQAEVDLKTLFLCWISYTQQSPYEVFYCSGHIFIAVLGWQHELKLKAFVSVDRPILPAVFSAIGKRQTCSVVNTRCFIIHTLQTCKRQVRERTIRSSFQTWTRQNGVQSLHLTNEKRSRRFSSHTRLQQQSISGVLK